MFILAYLPTYFSLLLEHVDIDHSTCCKMDPNIHNALHSHLRCKAWTVSSQTVILEQEDEEYGWSSLLGFDRFCQAHVTWISVIIFFLKETSWEGNWGLRCGWSLRTRSWWWHWRRSTKNSGCEIVLPDQSFVMFRNSAINFPSHGMSATHLSSQF